MNRETKKAVHSNLEFMILSMIAENETLHGYKIISAIRKAYGVYEGPSTVYPLLSELKKNGLIKLIEQRIDSGRLQNIYSITRRGIEVLKSYYISLSTILEEAEKTINTC